MSNITKTKSKKQAGAKPATRSKANKSRIQPSRLDQLEALLRRPKGASIAEMTNATGWQAHSVRGAMAGALKKRDLTITSEKVDKVRRYHATRPEQ